MDRKELKKKLEKETVDAAHAFHSAKDNYYELYVKRMAAKYLYILKSKNLKKRLSNNTTDIDWFDNLTKSDQIEKIINYYNLNGLIASHSNRYFTKIYSDYGYYPRLDADGLHLGIDDFEKISVDELSQKLVDKISLYSTDEDLVNHITTLFIDKDLNIYLIEFNCEELFIFISMPINKDDNEPWLHGENKKQLKYGFYLHKKEKGKGKK